MALAKNDGIYQENESQICIHSALGTFGDGIEVPACGVLTSVNYTCDASHLQMCQGHCECISSLFFS
jgi:hypothetical protein